MTPHQRHTGEDIEILVDRKQVYTVVKEKIRADGVKTPEVGNTYRWLAPCVRIVVASVFRTVKQGAA